MKTVKILGIVLIIAGILGAVFGGFNYTKETQEVKMGPIEMTVKDRQTVDIPIWASISVMVLGGVLLFLESKKN
ncbi:MAG: hypothetical protein PHI79_03170 [Sulfurovaceae bacterium]|nr:hypothetical protein [Sulfurovaceae bacterium]MDD5548582.1 hypothetical protein [Sulfurovaceae bacterium]